MIDKSRLPRHIAIILDGNGRWADRKGLPKIFGHRAGVKAVDEITEECVRLGIEFLTLYAFSAENWKRSKKEIEGIMNLLCRYLRSKYNKLQRNKVRLNAIGRLRQLPPKAQESLFDVMRKTSKNKGMTLTLALNYGGRQEIVDAARALLEQVQRDRISAREITEENFAEFLYTKGLPDVDLLIRSSGEMRISNFLLWQISYAEMFVTQALWPDFTIQDLYRAIGEYQSRERRFGGR